MIERDRELLVRMSRFNRYLGAVVVELFHRQDGGELPAVGLCALADRFAALSAGLHARAAELDSAVPPTPRRSFTPLPARQWDALDDVLAEMCERTDGSLEDLHDRGRGILETCRPVDASVTIEPDDDSLERRIYQAIGALAHLADAAANDVRAMRDTGQTLADLARDMQALPTERAA